MKRLDIHGRKIDYDAPGQLGAHSPKPEKLPFVPRFKQQLDAVADYRDSRGETEWPLHVTLAQLRLIMKVPKEQVTFTPTGKETYRNHPLVVIDDE